MAKEKNIAQWLRNWLAGDSNSEQGLRDAAREDTFLSDAMEGYEQFPESNHEASLERLHSRLAHRTQVAERRSLVWYIPRVAAAASVLLISVWLINENLKPDPMDIALNEPSVETPTEDEDEAITETSTVEALQESEEEPGSKLTTTTPPSAPPPATSSAGAGAKQSLEKPETENKERQVAEERTSQLQTHSAPEAPVAAAAEPASTIQNEPTAYQAEEVLADVPITKEDIDAGAPPVLEEEAKDDAIVMGRKESRPASVKPADNTRKLRGLITDTNGEPIIGATIIEPGTTNGTMTDFDGQFDIALQQNSEQLEVSYTGYETKVVPLKNRSFVEVQMDEGMSLDEVVVVDFKVPMVTEAQTTSGQIASSSKKARKKSKESTAKANKEFRRFVKNNQGYPQAAKDNKIEGEVIIEFDIDAKRRPVNFKIVKSLGYGCDEEAIRLLKEGPDWEKGKRGRVRFEFK